jgi:hypothetical protein
LTPDGIEFSRYRRMVITRSLAVAAVGAAVGLWAWYPDDMSRVYGFLLGAAVSTAAFLWYSWRTMRMLSRTEMTKKGAAVSSATTYISNYAAAAVALLVASLVPQVDFWGTAAGLLVANIVVVVSEAVSCALPQPRSQE